VLSQIKEHGNGGPKKTTPRLKTFGSSQGGILNQKDTKGSSKNFLKPDQLGNLLFLEMGFEKPIK